MAALTNERKVDEIMEIHHKICDEWEDKFMASVAGRVRTGKPLTPKQQTHLDKIYQKAVDSPF